MKNFLRLFVLSIMSIAFYFNLNAQTVHVDPAGAGGFELGADMASNGWTEINSVQSYFVGSAPVQATGNNCGYTSTVNGTWTAGTAASVAHIYRDISIPAGESKVAISLKYKTLAVDAGWDFLKVHLVPVTTTPVAGTQLTTGQIGANTDGTTAYATYNFVTLVTPGTTYRLVISFRQDGVSPYGAAAVDDISVTSSVPGNFISIITGNWNDPLTWDANAVPTAADNATVSTGHTVTVNATGLGINNLLVNGTLAYNATPTQFNVNGNLTVNPSGLVNVFATTTGKTLLVSGNIVNDGRIDISVGTTTAGNLTLNGSSPQTISGAGAWGGTNSTTTNANTVGVIRNLTCSNTSTTTPNIIWSFNNIRIVNNLNLTGARINLGTNKLIFGNYAAGGTLTSPVTAGFLPGGTFARWWAVATTGSAITAGIDPTNTTSRYPFLNTAGTSNRAMYITRTGSTTGNVAGELAVTYADASTMTTGLSVVDGAYTVTDRYDGNWTVTSGPGYFHAGLHTAVLLGTGAYPPLNGNSRVMLANAPAGGTHQNGTTSPGAQRISMTLADLTAGPLYLGIASADNQYPCAGTPNVPEALATTATSICPNGTVTMNATGMTTGFIGITNQWQVSSVSGGPYANVVGGTGATTATHTTAAITTPGTYYYVLASTCTNSLTTSYSNEVVVTVNTPPTVIATAANAGSFCGVGSLTATGAVTYSWAPAASLLSNTGATVTSIATANTTFTVTGTDANGCVNTATAAITYTAPPAITITATNPNFCGTGGASILTAASAGAYSYVWEALDGATLSTTTGNTTDATVTQTSSIRVTGTESATGCVEIQNYSIGVYPLPSATVTTTASGVCPGTSATINSGLSAGNFSSISITPAPITAPASATTLVTGGVATPALSTGSLDDGGWNNIPVGFNFNFFGTNYNTITIGTNGTLFFGGGNVADFTFTTLPSATEPFNMVAVLAMDNNLGGADGGTIKYWTEGYAPNRKFIVSYTNVKEFGDTKYSTSQAIFYETTGIIEVHVTSSTNVDRNKLVGINNGNGTVGVLAYASGTTASATNPIANPFAYRFTPPSNYTTIWTATDANGSTQIANGTNIFSQSVAPTITTTYAISYTNQTTGCTNAAGSAQVVMAVLGTVAPTGVTAQASSNAACSGVSFNLSCNYTGLTDGLTYQWQVSTDGGLNYTDITGATGLTYSTSLTAASSYRIGITSCGGTIEYSAPVAVGLSPPTDCYCTPVYTSGTSAGDLISNVTIVGTTLSNNTGFVQGTPSYTFYTGQPNYTATLLPSSSYTLQVSTGEWGDQGYAAWIDYNDDGVFDATELIGATPTTIGSGFTSGQINASSSFTIALACTPPAGVHRLRIRGVYNQNGPTIQPCASYTWGETEDYLITIAPAPSCPAPGLMTAGTTTTTTAPLSWNMGCSVATNFDFEYGPAGFTQGTGTSVSNQLVTVSGTTGTYTLSGLTPNTQYSVYYRANCGAGDVSPWSVATNFTTQCAPISLNSPSSAVVCDTYTLPALNELVASNNAGLTLAYYNAPNGTGGQITGPITFTQQVYAHGEAGSCSTDSVFTVTVYNTPALFVQNPTICLGDSTVLWATQGTAIDFVYTLNGNFIGSGLSYHVQPTTTTTYGISAVGLGGCTSAQQQATVTVNQPTTSSTSVTACDSYSWNGQMYNQSGTYTYTGINALGCDSVATLNLTINYSTTGSETITSCDSLVWNGLTYTQSGTYTYLTTNAVGCDSTVTLNLTINNSSTSSESVTACVSYQWNGQTYTQSGTYTFTTQNAVGCDSIATLNLTINNALFTTETVSACIDYTWNGQTYTQSGTYTYLTTSVNGCDSTVTLNLIINQPNSSTTTQTACDSYAWNGQTYTQSGTYVFNTTTVAGCDSTATLVLTVNSSSSSSSTASACGSYTWNGQTYTQSGTYTFATQNAAGCDSIATLNLTINAVPNATAIDNGDGTGSASAGTSYQWIDCANNTAITGATQQTFAPVVTGSYSVIVTNAAGCSDTSSCVTINVANVEELSKFTADVYPNPSEGIFNLFMNINVGGKLTITDATGRIVQESTFEGASTMVDLSQSVTGIYYITLKADSNEKVIRVIKN